MDNNPVENSLLVVDYIRIFSRWVLILIPGDLWVINFDFHWSSHFFRGLISFENETCCISLVLDSYPSTCWFEERGLWCCYFLFPQAAEQDQEDQEDQVDRAGQVDPWDLEDL